MAKAKSASEQEKTGQDIREPADTPGTEALNALPNPCVWCGPTVPGVARQYTTYQGGIPETLKAFLARHPDARRLVVSPGKFPAMRRNLDRAETAEAALYRKIKAELP